MKIQVKNVMSQLSVRENKNLSRKIPKKDAKYVKTKKKAEIN